MIDQGHGHGIANPKKQLAITSANHPLCACYSHAASSSIVSMKAVGSDVLCLLLRMHPYSIAMNAGMLTYGCAHHELHE